MTTWIIRTDLPHTWTGDADPLGKFLSSKAIDFQYIAFNEIGKQGEKKEHQHIVLIADTDKKDTMQGWVTDAFPELKASRKGRGGLTKYSVSVYDPECDQPYDEFRLDYVCKDGNWRCGTLWNAETIEYRICRRSRWLEHNAPRANKKNRPVQKGDERLRDYIKELMKGDEEYFAAHYQDTLIEEIIKYYEIYGKPNNRSWVRVVAEQVLFFAPLVAPSKSKREAKQDRLKAVRGELEKLTNPP